MMFVVEDILLQPSQSIRLDSSRGTISHRDGIFGWILIARPKRSMVRKLNPGTSFLWRILHSLERFLQNQYLWEHQRLFGKAIGGGGSPKSKEVRTLRSPGQYPQKLAPVHPVFE